MPDQSKDSAPQVLVVTGMSGAGRSSAAKVLEDLSFSVIDNLPPQLIGQAISHHEVAERRRRLAVVIDSRVGDTLEPLTRAIDELERQGVRAMVLFLEADDSHLVRRYEENRRPHPLRRGSITESIAAERLLLSQVKEAADVVIDTTDLNIHELRGRINDLFAEESGTRPMRVNLTSFGYKHGLPRDADLVLDVRFLPNPHWVPELRPQIGTDPQVRDYVLGFAEAKEFLAKVEELLAFLIPRYEDEGKSYLSLGIGCTGGHHRSVALAEQLRKWLDGQGIAATVRHRDIEK
ncbi:MAG TPA: RNase adapter RapZ [Acidimicrobiia bacterium]|nr:RNase adapter RapZ [Acidimicrobiia bacterium]